MANDEFASSDRTEDNKAKSPDSGLPYYAPASQSSMRDKLPRINVPPSTISHLNAIISSGKIPEFRDTHSIIRYCLSVGFASLDRDLKNPDFNGFVNHWTTLAELDLVSNKIEGFRALANKVEEITRDHNVSPDLVDTVRRRVEETMNRETDEYYKRELEQMLARIR